MCKEQTVLIFINNIDNNNSSVNLDNSKKAPRSIYDAYCKCFIIFRTHSFHHFINLQHLLSMFHSLTREISLTTYPPKENRMRIRNRSEKEAVEKGISSGLYHGIGVEILNLESR